MGSPVWGIGMETHLKYKSNVGSTQKFQEVESHPWGCPFAGNKVKE